jgi:hypothetical protein
VARAPEGGQILVDLADGVNRDGVWSRRQKPESGRRRLWIPAFAAMTLPWLDPPGRGIG